MTLHKEHGLSMIELLIALALSSLLILGVTQIFIDNRSNYLFQQGQSENIENGRYALLVLERQLVKAGYRRHPSDSLEFAFPAASTADCTFDAGQVIAVDGDTLCLRYQPRNEKERDCASDDPNLVSNTEPLYKPFTGSVIERIFIENETLKCNNEKQTVELSTGVSAIRFDFGVGPAGVREVTHYTNIPTSTDSIRSLRYALLMASDRGNRQGMTSQAYLDWHGDEAEIPDNRLYHTVSSGITLRNLMP